MDIRYSCNQKDFKRYTTEEMRDEMLITGLYKADEVVAVYSHVDRMVTLGCMPVRTIRLSGQWAARTWSLTTWTTSLPLTCAKKHHTQAPYRVHRYGAFC